MSKTYRELKENLIEDGMPPATNTASVANPILPIGDTPKKQNYKEENKKKSLARLRNVSKS